MLVDTIQQKKRKLMVSYNRDQIRKYRKEHPHYSTLEKKRRIAVARATRRLISNHPEEYSALLKEEREKLGL